MLGGWASRRPNKGIYPVEGRRVHRPARFRPSSTAPIPKRSERPLGALGRTLPGGRNDGPDVPSA
jgi:hypothetical protein